MEDRTILTEEQNECVSGGVEKKPNTPKIITCLHCKSTKLEVIKTVYDEKTQRIIQTIKCKNCGFIFSKYIT